ncbi:MAG: ribosome-associated translation inhibitor RaiA [Desulfobacterales bacterium]|nr:ribosome-associated translation inhibitor RaiA [Desulfobacterales bacterium]
MHTSVTFKNIDPSDNLRTYAEEKLDRFDRFLDSPAEANVVLSVEKFRHIAEINVIGRKLNIVGKEETNDMYSAIDMVLDKIGKQLKKNKEKIRDRRGGAKIGEFAAENINLEEAGRKRVMVKNIEYKPMDVDEAIMQMDLVTDNFLVFSNAKTDQINVLYRRKDGNLGLIQPNS